MKLIEELLKAPSARRYNAIVAYIGNHPSRVTELVNAFLRGPYRLTQRASTPLNRIAKETPALLGRHLRTLVEQASKPDASNAVKRNTMRLLQFAMIPTNLRGRVTDLCFKFLSQSNEPIAVRVFSMTVLANISIDHPEIGRELMVTLEDLIPFGSAGLVSRGNKVLKKLRASRL